MITVTGKHPVCHFLSLVGHPMGFQSAGSNTYQVENVPVLPDQRAMLPFLKMYPEKMSIKRKMMAAAMNDQVLDQLLNGAFTFYS